MFRFAVSDALWGLVAVPLLAVFLWYAAGLRRRALQRFGDSAMIGRLSHSVDRRARLAKTAMILTSVLLLVLALSRPQFGNRVETVRVQGKDVMVALDLSESMYAQDVGPNRLERSKLEVARLMAGLHGDRIGLVAFAGEAFLQSPLTTDYGAATLFLNAMEPDLVPVQGTNLGAAISVALDSFRDDSLDYKVIVIITDGEDHEGEIEAARERAIEAGVGIYTVGVGSSAGVPIPELDEAGNRAGFKRDEDGNVVTTRLDEATLRQLADATGGHYYRSTPEVSELDALTHDLAALGSRELETREIIQFDEQFQLALGLALMLLMVEAALSDRRRGQGEWQGRIQ